MKINDLQQAILAVDAVKQFLLDQNSPAPKTLRELVESDEWPVAVPPEAIVNENDENDLAFKAELLLEIFVEGRNIEGKRFLDANCGLGHIVLEADRRGSKAVGYGARADHPLWTGPDSKLTSDRDSVKNQGPYDYVLLYDALDHMRPDEAVDLLAFCKSVLAPDGLIRVRCHPFCGRHGGHLYRQRNKAYLHLVFNDAELREMGVTAPFYVEKIVKPIKSYLEYFGRVGLTKAEEKVTTSSVEPFFYEQPAVRARIQARWTGTDMERQWPQFQLSQEFIDFTLKA